MNLGRIGVAALLFCLLSAPVGAETRKAKFWRISLIVLGGASVADASMSWGKMETNPLLRANGGRFGAQSVALKTSLAGAAMLFQWRLVRREPKMETYMAGANVAVASLLAGAAVRGARTPKVR